MKPSRPAKKTANSKTAKSQSPASRIFPVVGFGASAGGLEAFTHLLGQLPVDTGMAFVLVQHLDPKHDSMLTELLGRATRMPVKQAANHMAVERNRVYVIPPNADLAIADGKLKVYPRTTTRGLHLPVDTFLRSLAEERGGMAIGVILSGTASDGTLGLKAIKAEGGITFAQSEKSAKYSGMPTAAIAAGAVDYVLPPDAIARELARIGRHPYLSPALDMAVLGSERDGDLPTLLAMLRSATQVDFTYYKPSTVRRRIARRMVVRKIERLPDYLAFVKKNPAELQDLYQDILINVTSFFRDPAVFRALKKTVLTRLLKGRKRDDPLRIWVPGCATGEEAYSLAITAIECVREAGNGVPVQIFASDISDPCIEKARAGIYPEGIARDVPPDILHRYFVPVASGYQVTRGLREMCVFARQNVVRDAPFSKLDLISCRNVLIYFGAVLQRRALAVFHYALKPGGYLLRGASETVGSSKLFTLVDKKHKIYTSRPNGSRAHLEFPPIEPVNERPETLVTAPESTSVSAVTREADRIVLGKYAPTGVVVNDEMQVLQFRGRTGKFLEPEPGEANFNLFKMAREGLGLQLRSAIQKARRKNETVRNEGVHVPFNGGSFPVTLEVIPLRRSGSRERHFLVLFEEASAPVPGGEPPQAPGKTQEGKDVRRLKQELEATKQYLQSTVEDLESNNAELKSANEEIQSSNEELQSMNEEMETAKEELQSTNEELTTVNEELENRNVELARANNDLNNLLSSVQIPLVMVDNDLRLRRFTPAAEKLLNLIPADVGRPLLNINPNIEVPDLRKALRDVIDHLRVVEQEVRGRGDRSFSMWIRPYRTSDNRIDGAVLALLDVTDLKRSMEHSRDLLEYAEAIAATVREPFLVLDGELHVITANAPFYQTFGLSRNTTEKRLVFDIGHGDWNIPELRALLKPPREDGFTEGIEIDHAFRRVGRKVLSINSRRVPGSGKPRMILLAIEDISARRLAEDALHESQERFSALEREAPVGILHSDTKGKCTFASMEACRIAGVTPEDALGLGWTRHVHADDLPLLNATRLSARAREKGFSLEFRFELPGRGLVWAHLISICLPDKAGGVTGYLVAITDITERKRLEEQLRQSQKMEAIGRLAGGVAHDFSNMLTVISGCAAQLQTSIPEDYPARKAADQIRKVGDQAAVLTRQLLAFSRKQVLRPAHASLNDVVRDMHDLLARLLGESIEIVLELGSDLGAVVVDHGQIQQVILNLAINARDAMPRGGRLTVTTANLSLDQAKAQLEGLPEGNYVTLSVTDTGAGMTQEIRDRLFEPFFTTKPPGAGTGLGLSTVYGIAQRSGGTIRVESEVGRGTTFQIYLPRAGGDFEPAGTETHEPVSGGTETILLVEDAAVVRSLVRELLELGGYTVLEARDGGEALTLSENHDGVIHLLLTDLMMPRMGGHELAKRIRRRRRGIQVIYMSGYSGEALHAVEKEANFLEKPFEPNELAAAVRRVLDEKTPPR